MFEQKTHDAEEKICLLTNEIERLQQVNQ